MSCAGAPTPAHLVRHHPLGLRDEMFVCREAARRSGAGVSAVNGMSPRRLRGRRVVRYGCPGVWPGARPSLGCRREARHPLCSPFWQRRLRQAFHHSGWGPKKPPHDRLCVGEGLEHHRHSFRFVEFWSCRCPRSPCTWREPASFHLPARGSPPPDVVFMYTWQLGRSTTSICDATRILGGGAAVTGLRAGKSVKMEGLVLGR